MLEEEAQHFPRCIRSSRVSIRTDRAATRPCVSSSVYIPVLHDSASSHVAIDGAGIGMSSRYLPAIMLLLQARRFHCLLNDLTAVLGMHSSVAIAVKNNRWDR